MDGSSLHAPAEAAESEFPDMVAGDLTGIAFPTSVAAFEKAGPAFLTTAFRATGVLAADNAVTAITNTMEFFGGGMGRKLWLDVSYARNDPGLLTGLFVKFAREFGDPLRELFSPVMEPEVRFSLLSRRDDFPIRVPTCYFADYHVGSLSGLLITERIPYGQHGIQPAHDKCMEYLIENPLEHYQAQVRGMAALAAHHRAGRFGEAIERQFPFDANARAAGIIPFTPEQLAGKLEKLRWFAAVNPRLMPAELRSQEFLDGFAADAMFVRDHEAQILQHLDGQADLIALCHWNMNLDNAWFWRDESGTLRSGLLDWGGVSQMNLAQAFIGMICAAETEFLDAHEAELRSLLLAEYRAHGGPAVDLAAFTQSVRLANAVLGIAWMLDAPALIEAEIPDIAAIESRFDPLIRDKFIPRAQLQLMVTFPNEWRRGDIGAVARGFVGV